jgi:hypothetical protein
MGFIDFLLFPFYVMLFYFLFSIQRKKLKDPQLKFYHKYGFWVKVLASFCITIFNVYISPGDSTALYYREGVHLYRHILNDFSNLEWIFKSGLDYPMHMIARASNKGYFAMESNFVIIKLVAVFGLFSFGKYMIINLFFSMLAFSGIWKLFMFFYDLYPNLHKKIAIAVLFLPTVVFWSSGALKDPVCMAMLGWFTYSAYNIFCKKRSVVINFLIVVASAIVLATVKPYILFAYVPFFVTFLIFTRLGQVQNHFFRLIAFLFIGVASILAFSMMSQKLDEEMGNLAVERLSESLVTQQNNFTQMSDRAESSFSLGLEYDGQGLGGLLKVAPAAINATLFRPYLWESRKLSTLLSSLESLTLMICFLIVLWKVGPIRFFMSLVKDPMIMFCFFFSIMFALFIGVTTLNFGTLVRYKIPCMPFFVMALFLIYEKRTRKLPPEKVAVPASED